MGRFGKLNSALAFPEHLDLAPYMAPDCLDEAPARYSLYAVVQHIDWGRSTDKGGPPPPLPDGAAAAAASWHGRGGEVCARGTYLPTTPALALAPYLLALAGHYVSFVRCGEAWFHCDDGRVTRVAATKVLAANAYLLFFQREQPRAIAAGPRTSPPTLLPQEQAQEEEGQGQSAAAEAAATNG